MLNRMRKFILLIFIIILNLIIVMKTVTTTVTINAENSAKMTVFTKSWKLKTAPSKGFKNRRLKRIHCDAEGSGVRAHSITPLKQTLEAGFNSLDEFWKTKRSQKSATERFSPMEVLHSKGAFIKIITSK
jgi:hypothetical protein